MTEVSPAIEVPAAWRRSGPALVRGVTVIVVAIEVLTSSERGATRQAQLACLIVGTLAVVAWGVISWRRTTRAEAVDKDWLVVVFTVMAAASAAGTGGHVGALIAFAALAAVGAGAGCGLLGGIVVASVGVLAMTIGAIVGGDSSVGTLGDCLVVVVALFIGRSRQSYRIQAEQSALLLAQADQLRAEQSQVATLTERARIAREIHDVLAHSLGALGVQIQTARVVLSEQHDSEQTLTVLERAQRIATEGLEETRRAVQALRVDTRPLEEELADLVATHESVHGVRVDFHVEGLGRQLRPDSSLALLRIAQEALVNAAKHSPSQPITMVLRYDPMQTHLQVSNPLQEDGASNPPPALATLDAGYGLVGMRERLLLLHGSLTAVARGGLWEVTALVPR